jgi:hypothetical protein
MARLTDDAVSAGRVARAKNRAEVVRVFDAIQHHDQCRRCRVRVLDQIV